MNEVYFELQGRIHLGPGISSNDKLKSLTCLISSNSHLQELASFLEFEALECPDLTLFKKNDNYYLVYRVDQVLRINEQMQTLEKVIGISPRVICYELDNEKQMIIEKTYFNIAGKIYKYSQKKAVLTFVKQAYQSRISTETIKYFGNLNEMSENVQKSQLWSMGLPIKDLLSIFDNCSDQPNIDISKLMVTYERVQMLRGIKLNIDEAQRMIFFEERPRKDIEKDIYELKLPRDITEKLLWKCKQIQKYRNLRKELLQINSNDYSKCSLNDLTAEIIYVWVGKYENKWMKNSFSILKKKFWAIANQRDQKAIQKFHSQYQGMLRKLQQVESTFSHYQKQKNKGKSQIIMRMKNELDWFMNYHELIISNSSLSSIRYMRQEALYLWKYDNRVYKKITLFVLITLLAYSQNNYILGLTIFLVGLISLQVRF